MASPSKSALTGSQAPARAGSWPSWSVWVRANALYFLKQYFTPQSGNSPEIDLDPLTSAWLELEPTTPGLESECSSIDPSSAARLWSLLVSIFWALYDFPLCLRSVSLCLPFTLPQRMDNVRAPPCDPGFPAPIHHKNHSHLYNEPSTCQQSIG